MRAAAHKVSSAKTQGFVGKEKKSVSSPSCCDFVLSANKARLDLSG
jgi:hypothetical protein